MKLLPPIAVLLLGHPAVAQDPPAAFQFNVAFGAQSHLADFELHSARGPNFSIEVQQANGSFIAHTPDSVRTYIGVIPALPGAMASALRRADGSTHYHVLFEDGAEWINNGSNTVLRTDENWTPNDPTLVTGTGGAGSNVWAAEVGVDIPYEQYSVDNDVDAALEMVEHSVNTVNLLYLRDTSIVHRLGRVVIRADASQDPYEGLPSIGDLFSEVGNQWNNVLPPSTHDLGLVASPAVQGNGLASVGTIGSPGYSANGSTPEGDFSVVWRHEAGHNWSLSHFDGGTPEGATINSGNALSRMSGSEQAKAVAHRDLRLSFLDNLGPYTTSIPPRASLDRATFTTQQQVGFTIDVLDNDHDANGEPLSIASFSANSLLGGTVALSPGTGPGGRDELLYTPPAVLDTQADHFTYRITDSSGREALGNVVTTWLGPGLVINNIVPATAPSLSATTAQNITITGKGLNTTSGIRVDGVPLSGFPAEFTVVNDSTITLALPLQDTLGIKTITLESPLGDDSIPLEVVAPANPVVRAGSGGDPEQIFSFAPLVLRMGGGVGDIQVLVASTMLSPSQIPGLVQFDIGNNFAQLVQVGPFPTTSAGWTQSTLNIAGLPFGTPVYFQTVEVQVADPSATPYETSNVAPTQFVF